MKQAFKFDNSYARELEGFYAPWQAEAAPSPKLIKLNLDLAAELGLDASYLESSEGILNLAGNNSPEGAESLAMAYAGHQFGGFSPQLGDGRAVLLGELIDKNGQRRDLHLKGSGRTPFSRGGDGKAVLGPVLREYLIGEAMHALGIPTTRALAAVSTGEKVFRNGYEPGAVLARIASSHLRVGTFQYFSARGEDNKLQTLADYAIARHYPELKEADNPYLALLTKVIDKQASLVAKWFSVGFVHGVMNTDNTTISGETIDYGPCAFIDNYDLNAVFSSIDQQGRYAYGNQASILQWNMARFAETLIKLIDPNNYQHAIDLATEELEAMPSKYESHLMHEMQHKLGLESLENDDRELINELLKSLQNDTVDYTKFFCTLAKAAHGEQNEVLELFSKPQDFMLWLSRWQQRIKQNAHATAQRMNQVNPIYIPRNHKVDEALKEASEQGNMTAYEDLLSLVLKPYREMEGKEDFAAPPPEGTAPCVTFCGT